MNKQWLWLIIALGTILLLKNKPSLLKGNPDEEEQYSPTKSPPKVLRIFLHYIEMYPDKVDNVPDKIFKQLIDKDLVDAEGNLTEKGHNLLKED